MQYQIAVDTGGTFTDVVVSSSDGSTWISKSLTDTGRAFSGIEGAIADIAVQAGTTTAEIFAQADLLLYGTTRSTNAVVEQKTDATALICTRGFRDTLYLREGGKLEPFNYHIAYPKPYIPRRLTFEIDERVDARGEVVRTLDEPSVRRAVEGAVAGGARAIAVSLLWSMLRPEHEQRVREIIHEIAPDVAVTLSHELNPIVREYRRSSSTAIDASLKPLMQGYLRRLGQDLKDAGFTGNLLLATSFGGAWEAEDVIERPIYSIGSGPALAPRAALSLLDELEEFVGTDRDAIVCDVGGTTFDVSVVSEGEIFRSSETWLGGKFVGHMLGISCVDVRSIGAGGGSIAWVDEGGLLRLGPHSAGADPGPAAYGRGGTRPTVTDAAVVLGYLDPAAFLGGRMGLDVDAARTAIETEVATPLGLSIDTAASGILRLAAEAMVSAIKDVTVGQGIDPRSSVIVSGGGAGGLNIATIARELECTEVLVPSFAGVMSAWGGHRSDIVTEIRRTFITASDAFDEDGVNRVLADIAAELDRKAAELKVDITSVTTEFFAEARYPNQLWELPIALDGPSIVADEHMLAIVERFHRAHERHYTVREDGSGIEVLTWVGRLVVTHGMEAQLTITKPESSGEGSGDEATAYFDAVGRVAANRVDSARLTVGDGVAGPAFIDEPTTTIVIPPDWTAHVTPGQHYRLVRTTPTEEVN
ncbi:hydantoinase/oxoprolinase family protein [Microbacterium sp.]|uniref:hydantoinase/oxoprolinase family protein n=1 Tax=Microbacterium sp. TaxID=51671 RepID=UPI003A928351